MKDIGVIFLQEIESDRFGGQSGQYFVGSTPRRFREIFTFSRKPRVFKGIHKLAQMISKILLTEPGSDQYSPELGCGLISSAKSPLGRDGLESTKRDIAISLSVLEERIISTQTGLSLPPDERLQELDLVYVDFDFSTGIWDIQVRVISEAGNAVSVNLDSVTLNGA